MMKYDIINISNETSKQYLNTKRRNEYGEQQDYIKAVFHRD